MSVLMRNGAAPVLICLLGSFRLVREGCPVPMRGGSKMESLLGMLALGPPHGVSRDSLLASVWPDSEPPLASQSLNSLVHYLQRLLGPHLRDGGQLMLRENGCYRLNFEAGVAVDAIRFAALADDGDRRLRELDLAAA